MGCSDCGVIGERGAIVSVSHVQIWLVVSAEFVGKLLVRKMLGNSGIRFAPGLDLGACGMRLAMRLRSCPIDVGQGHALFPLHEAKVTCCPRVSCLSWGL